MTRQVLILEDRDNVRRSMARLLEDAGYAVVVARNALEAQALCAEVQPDVAIVDIELPGLRGDEWALYLKEMSPETRIIFASGRPGLAGMDRYGPDVSFLHKPFAPEALLELVAEPGLASAA